MKELKQLPIAIDGPAASGKTTVGKMLAKKLKRYFLDTGLMYRYLAWKLLHRYGSLPHDEAVRDILKELKAEEFSSLLLSPEEPPSQWEDRIKDLLSPEISKLASLIATKREVRQFLNAIQRDLAERYPLVVIGRDATTVVFKDSPHKFFLDASFQERVKRRVKQLRELGLEVDEAKIAEEMRERDERDSKREIAPLKVGEGVILINTDKLTPEEVVERIIENLGGRSSQALEGSN